MRVFKKNSLKLLGVILFVFFICLLHSYFNPLIYGVFSIKQMEKRGTATITKIILCENGNEAKIVLGDNQKVVEQIENLKLRNHFFNYTKGKTSNYIAIEYHTTDNNGQLRLSDTLYIFDNGFYCDVVAEPFPIWERKTDLYSFIKDILDEE